MVQALEGESDRMDDFPQAIQLLGEMNGTVQKVNDLVENMLHKVRNGELTTEHGLSYLEVKYHMLLNYLINVTYVVLRKCSGETINSDPSIERLIEIRTILEKTRPIDSKLRYQIDKLVKSAVSGATANASDATTFKPNPENMGTIISPTDDVPDGDDDNDEKTSRNRDGTAGKYVPPKLTAMHYDDDESKQEKMRKQMDRAKKRSLGLSIINDLKEEYLENPVEISSSSRAQQILSQSQREKEEYEETYLTRLPITKAEKQRQRKLTTLGSLGDEMTRFGQDSKEGKKQKRKLGAKKMKGKKRRFK